ncbi:hypothetical protein [Allocoleopsis franciscana]|uniref:Uncharacterized protein n=1 Tax=Allocoleopsis franciscana PCC 7113 TaxID=1173027 RepID=K9WM84_9CYAN|nr:hypothetical protein [Allocoleopsis franciscana]AFZ20627.1 hypothetical protein Mic7113_4966 [Allocoleopsis franciscana PCC 7113]
MEKVGKIDAMALGRPNISQKEIEKRQGAKLQQQKEEGYQQLAELCRLGEYDAAQQLAIRNSRWGYEVVDGVVMERID